jgi:hypothetical protein
MKIRRQRNALRLKLPAFCTPRERKKFSLLKHAGITSLRTRDIHGDHVGTVQIAHLDLEHIIIASCCLFMSIFFIAVIAVGRD